MRCPFCHSPSNRVVDSRESNEGLVIRRRRSCDDCERRFTTYERVEELLPAIVKRDARREPFDRTKLIRGLRVACSKRPVSEADLEALVSGIERKLQESGEKELPSEALGEEVMRQLIQLDEVAYVRFASVYRRFADAAAFMAELRALPEQSEAKATAPTGTTAADPAGASSVPGGGARR